MITLSQALLVRLRMRLGMKETSRNRGREIDVYHRWAGLKPEDRHPWCCSGLGWNIAEQCRELGIPSPFPRTAKAIRVFDLAPHSVLRPNPAPGYLYVLAHAKHDDLLRQWKNDRYTTAGHIGAIETVDDNGYVDTEISGNTSGAGGREGNQWARHHGPPEVAHGGMLMGFIDLDAWAELLAGGAA